MKTQRTIAPILALLIFSGCASILPGNDPTLVNAERTTALAYTSFDSFFALERNQDAFVKANLPQVHKFANDLRRNAPHYLSSARQATEAYRLNRSAENKATLDTLIAVLQNAMAQIGTYTAEITKGTP
jgi:hypothetical protein